MTKIDDSEPIVIARESTTMMSFVAVDPNGWDLEEVIDWVSTHEGEISSWSVDDYITFTLERG